MANIFTKEQHHGDPLNDHVFYFSVHVNRALSNLDLIDLGTFLTWMRTGMCDWAGLVFLDWLMWYSPWGCFGNLCCR